MTGAVADARRWAGWSVVRSLRALDVSPSAYYRRRAVATPSATASPAAPLRSPHAVLPEEREAVVRYAQEHPNPRHRALAWEMVDQNIACLSPSTVYRLLRAEGLVPRWPPERRKRRCEEEEKAHAADERWQSDIRYVQVGGRKYYLVLFLDEYSRYVVHHEVMAWLDGETLSHEAQRAVETLPGWNDPTVKKPVIQTDNGPGYISHEFKTVLSAQQLGHVRIRPHCPEENGLVERTHRTLGEVVDEVELRDWDQAREVIGKVVRWYNDERLHSALHFLRPVDYYRGQPETLLEARRRKVAEARHRRRERNLGIEQTTMAFEVMDAELRHTLISRPTCPAG